MKYIIIKFFPSAKIDYVSHYFFNFLFSLIFIINIPYIDNLLFFKDKPVYTLLIPFTEESYEENKDLIFSRLSINDRIISVKKIEKKVILEKLSKKIESELVPVAEKVGVSDISMFVGICLDLFCYKDCFQNSENFASLLKYCSEKISE